MVLMVVGITTDLVASNLGKGPSYPTSPRSQLSSSQLAKALIGRQFTRDVIPPDLATAPPLGDVFVADQIPGLVGESTTTTSDQGSTVTFYVFSDPLWAQAFMANPPIAYGCGVCTSMKGASTVEGVGDRATSFVLYRKSAAGESWIATTTYATRGAVVINAWFMPVNVGTPTPSSTDLYVPTAEAKAAVALLQRISAG
jgi:hypothetical protein